MLAEQPGYPISGLRDTLQQTMTDCAIPRQRPGLKSELRVEDGIIVGTKGAGPVLPTHELSGLPLLVLPIDPPQRYAQEWEDYDHGFYPRTSRELKGFGGAAVRCARGQDLPRWLHERKHKIFPEGPVLPTTKDDKYKTCVLACADFIPRKALDLNKGNDYEIVDLTDEQIQQFASSRSVHIEDANHANTGTFYRNTIGKFFAFHAIEQNLDHVNGAVIDEFLRTQDSQRKTELGNLLLAESVEVAVEPVRTMMSELQEQGLVQLTRKDPYTTVRKFFVKSRFKDYLSELHHNLERQPGHEQTDISPLPEGMKKAAQSIVGTGESGEGWGYDASSGLPSSNSILSPRITRL